MHAVAPAVLPRIGLRMTGRQLSNIMEYHVRPDVRRAFLESTPIQSACLPPPRWRPMIEADADRLVDVNQGVMLSDYARITPAPPCARSASGMPAIATLILATEAGERATLLDRLEQSLAHRIEGGAESMELLATLAEERGWPRDAMVDALRRLAETGALLIRD